ncbi:MAG: CDP-alcohol phosphatidyltransferase family protein [Magnetococcales bacterium]|nr:CDP-alcohol phosphatidyltransferase family protein [Magnetococcales bacterium]
MAYTIRELREETYEYHVKYFPYLDDYVHFPYTFIKARFFMWFSAIVIFLLLKTRITPNAVTVVYAVLGVVAGTLLAIPHPITIQVGLLIFTTKGVFDWCDGHYARITGQLTLRGHVLDSFGAHLGSLGFQIGLGFYVAWHNAQYTIPILSLVTLIPFFYTARLTFYADATIFRDVLSGRLDIIPTKSEAEADPPDTLRKTYNIIASYLDDWDRTVDLICLLVLIELYTSLNVTWIIFLLMVLKQAVICAGSFYIVLKGDWVEKKVKGVAGRDIEN